jgi:hypothetical protein
MEAICADVGVMQIGDLDWLWNEAIGNNLDLRLYHIMGGGGVDGRGLTNYFMGTGRKNLFFERCHKLFLALWNGNGATI